MSFEAAKSNNLSERRQLPQGWRWVWLGGVCEFILDGTHGSPVRAPNGVPLLSAKNVYNSALHFDYFDTVSEEEFEKFKNRLEIREGDVLLTIVGSIGRTAVVRTKRPFILLRSVAVLRPIRDILSSEFLHRVLESPGVQQQLTSKTKQGSQPGVYLKEIKETEIPLPPLPEQKRIAGILTEQRTAVERARAAAEAQLYAAKALPAAYLRGIFLSPEAHTWPKRKLGEIAILERGKFTPRPRNDPKYFGGPYPWIQIGEVESAKKYITKYNQTLNELGLEVSKMFPKGTLVISIAATIGAVGILKFDSCMPDSLVGITPREGLSDKNFLYYLLLFIRDHLQEIAPQMAQANLKLQILAPLEIPIPPLSEQRLIGSFLDEKMMGAERLIQTLEKELHSINALPAAFLRRAFNGEL